MFQSSCPSQCFDTISKGGTALDFLVICPEEQEILDNIPEWITSDSENEQEESSAKLCPETDSNEGSCRTKESREQHESTTVRERTLEHVPNQRVEVEECVPLLHNDLVNRHCRSLPSLIDPFNKLSVQNPSVFRSEKSNSVWKTNRTQLADTRNSTDQFQVWKERLGNPPSPSDRSMLRSAINHSINKTASQTIRTLSFVNELSVSKSKNKSNSCSILNSRSQQNRISDKEVVKNASYSRVSSISQDSSVRLQSEKDLQNQPLSNAVNVSQKPQRHGYSLRLACITEDTRETELTDHNVPCSSTQATITKEPSQGAPPTKLSKTYRGNFANRKKSKNVIDSSVNGKSLTQNEAVTVKNEKLTPQKQSTQYLDTPTVLNSQSQLVPSHFTQMPSTSMANSLEVPYFGLNVNQNNRRSNRQQISYLIGEETQTACQMMNQSDFNSSNERSKRGQDISPFSSHGSIDCAQPNIPEIIARLASPTSSQEDVQNVNAAAVNVSGSSRDLFLSQEALSQQSRASARKRLCFDAAASTSDHHTRRHSSAKKRKLESAALLSSKSKTANNIITIQFNASQRRDMANVIFKMYK